MKLIITGCAGFIGFFLAKARLAQGDEVIGIDNLNNYYDRDLKQARLKLLEEFPNFTFYLANIEQQINPVFQKHKPEKVIHLAAQAGVRYSLENPHAYVNTNVVGFLNILEACRHYEVEHLIYASSSSVYGTNTTFPYHESAITDTPLAIYAATKKSNELMAHSYTYLYGFQTTGLRFFTVYGPLGRPDMAFFKFTKNIIENKPIEVYNFGNMHRDFTYIDDIINGLSLVIDKYRADPFKIYNIGNGKTVKLLEYINAIETSLNKTAIKEYLPLQAGDVLNTHADISEIQRDYNYIPKTNVNEGIDNFVRWYQHFYKTANIT